MKKSEKVLLTAFAVMFLVIVGGGGGTLAFRNYLEVREEVESLRVRLAEMNLAVSQGAAWAEKHDWLDENIPGYTSGHATVSGACGPSIQADRARLMGARRP